MGGINWADLKKTADDATKPLPKDWYEVVVDKAEQKTASTGSEMISVVFKVDAGPHQGRALFTNLVLSPDSGFALSLFFRNLAALGIDDAYFQSLTQSGMDVKASLTAIAQAIVGRRARVEVGIRQWQGQDRNEVTNMQGATTGPGGIPGAPGPVSGMPPVPGAASAAPGTPPVPPTPAASAPPVPAAAPAASGEVTPPPLPF